LDGNLENSDTWSLTLLVKERWLFVVMPSQQTVLLCCVAPAAALLSMAVSKLYKVPHLLAAQASHECVASLELMHTVASATIRDVCGHTSLSWAVALVALRRVQAVPYCQVGKHIQ
jgi:hypothetical protein